MVRVSEHGDKTKNRAGLIFLLGLTAVALYLCYVLIAPFLKPILFSAVLAILFYPFHSHILRWIRNRNASALLSTSLAWIIHDFAGEKRKGALKD
jgi:predicted PurR-regulated permease PerM